MKNYLFIATFFLIFSFIIQSAYTWPSGWLYRRAITINNTQNSDNLADYQVNVTINTLNLISAGKMRSDCGDIRFIDSDDQTQLSYWIESGCNSASTRIWVKVPSIPASSTKTIYLYYGNPSATSQSNGTNTFDFFDDFSGDLSKWVQRSGTWSISNGVLVSPSTGSGQQIVTANFAILNARIRASYRLVQGPDTGGINNYCVLARTPDSSNYYWQSDWYTGNSHRIDKAVAGQGTLLTYTLRYGDTNWHVSEFLLNGSILNASIDGKYKISAIDSSLSNAAAVGFSSCGGQVADSPFYVDWVFVGKYTSPEPTTSVGSEEINQPPTLSYVWESPTDPATYSPGATYRFNITACDINGAVDISTVLFEWNGGANLTVTNYVAHNSTCRNYTTTKTDLAAGTYNYKWYVNDTQNKWASLSDNYTVNQSTNPIDIYLTNSTGTYKNQNITVIIGQQTTVNVTAVYPNSGTVALYEDGNPVSNPRTTTLPLGEHSYKGNISGNTNYTANATGATYYIKVIDITPPTYSLNSTNSTIAGTAVSHNLYWQDDVGLSGFIFSFDNCTGNLINDSWTRLDEDFPSGNSSTVSVTTNSYYNVFAGDYALNMSKLYGGERGIYTFGESELIGGDGSANAIRRWNNMYFYNSSGQAFSTSLNTTNSTVVESGPVRVLINYWNYSSGYGDFSDCGANVCTGWEEFSAFYPDRYFTYLTMLGNYTGFRFGGGGTYFTNFYYLDNTLWGAGVFTENNNLYNTYDFGLVAKGQIIVPSIAAKYYIIFYDNDTTNRTAVWVILNYTNWNGDQIVYDNTGGSRSTARVQSGNSQSNPGSYPNVSISWMWMFGRNGNITINNESSTSIHNSAYVERIKDVQNPASISSITGSFLGFERKFGTYNFTASSNKVDFNFTTGSYNRTNPVFQIKDLSNIDLVKEHVWWRNVTSGQGVWKKLSSADNNFLLQEGNSTYFGYNYILILMNTTLNANTKHEFWISNSSDPIVGAWSNVTKVINSTIGCTIRWCIYVNDTSNNWNSSCEEPFTYKTKGLNCEAGGPYSLDSKILVAGNVFGETSNETNVTINITKSGSLIASQTTTSDSSGIYYSIFNQYLDVGKYTVNVFANSSSSEFFCSDEFEVTSAEARKECLQKTISIEGKAIDTSGNPINSGKAFISAEGITTTNSTNFSNGEFQAFLTACFYPGERYLVQLTIIDDKGKKGTKYFYYLAT